LSSDPGAVQAVHRQGVLEEGLAAEQLDTSRNPAGWSVIVDRQWK
jgi:hypothetical protein